MSTVGLARWVLVLAVLTSPVASAETRRVAVLVGNNAGSGERPSLHFAEVDAGKMARVLVELGRVSPEDLFLLQGRALGAVRDVFAKVKERISAFHREADSRVVLVFYFSGHSDGEVLEIGEQRLPFVELRRWLSDAGADVRLGIIDSCKSGALLASKGGTPGPAFQVRLVDDLASTGEAMLTSSAADEIALESTEIRGSFFTHHLVSGLRGAADSSGDGLVTLAEAYQYAFSHTVSATAGTVGGIQHPVYDYRLAGQGELVLTELSRPAAALELPKGYDRVLVVQIARDQVIAELTAEAARHVAIPPGDYALRAWREGQAFAGRVSVLPGESRVVRSEELHSISLYPSQSKGPDALLVSQAQEHGFFSQPTLSLGVGAQPGVTEGVRPLVSVHAAVHFGVLSGPSLALNFAVGTGRTPSLTGPATRFTEGEIFLFAGYRWGLERGLWSVHIGPEIGGGLLFQSVEGGGRTATALAIGPWAGVTLRVSQRIRLELETHLPLTFFRRDGQVVKALLPAGWLGVAFPL